MKAMDFAMQHCYERASIVTDKELLRHALRFGVGDVDVESIKRQLLRDELIKEKADGREWFTTKEVLAEEKRLIDFVQSGKGKFKPFRRIIQFPERGAFRRATQCRASRPAKHGSRHGHSRRGGNGQNDDDEGSRGRD